VSQRLSCFTVKQVEFMPENKDKEHGVLYVSKRFALAIHLCACGCGIPTVTPFDTEDTHKELKRYCWDLTGTDDTITLQPSIGNQNFPCKSHYYITDNQIQWL